MIDRWKAAHEAEGLFLMKGKPGWGLCLVRGCRNCQGKKKSGLCDKHHQHRWRMRDKRKSAFTALRDSAKTRGIKFTITFDYLMGLMDAYAYFDHAAESRKEYPSLDRIEANRGYEPGNLRVITISQNAAKGNRERHLPGYIQSILDRKRARAKENPALASEQVPDESDCPF